MSVISNLMVKIGADSSGLKKGLKDAQNQIKKSFDTTHIENFGSSVEATGKRVEGLIGKMKTFAVVAGAGFGLTAFVKSAAEAGDNIYRLSQRMHITSAEAGTLSRIMSLTGGDVNTLSTAMMRLDKSYFGTSTEAEKCRAVLSAVGVTLTDQSGTLLPVNEQLKNLAEGYRKASEAGKGQEFIMSTLGVRGMALVTTLEQYNEASKAAAEVKTIGLDPKAMHELNMQMKVMEMESKQLSLAFVAAFGPVVQEILPSLLPPMQTMAELFKEHKKEIAELTKTAVEFYVAMKAISVISNVMSSVNSVWASLKTTMAETAAEETAITARQEAQLKKVLARTEAMYTAKYQAAIKAAQKEGLASEEAYAKLEVKLAEIQAEAERTAASVSEAFTRHFQRVNAGATAMAAKTNAAIESTAAAAVVATEKQTVATASLTEAHVAEGNAATVAGEKNVAAKTAATEATVRQTAAEAELAGATALAGNEAVVAGEKNVASSVMATEAVSGLTKAVALLEAQWMLVAFAIYEAAKMLQQYKMEELSKEVGGETVKGPGATSYTKDDHGNIWAYDIERKEIGDIDDDIGGNLFAQPFETSKRKVARGSEEYKEANSLWRAHKKPEITKPAYSADNVPDINLDALKGAGKSGGASPTVEKKKKDDTAQKIAEAKKNAEKLMAQLQIGINAATGTRSEIAVAAVEAEIARKRDELEKIRKYLTEDETNQINSRIDEFGSVLKIKISDDLEKANEEIRMETAKTAAEAVKDYEAMAKAEYEATVNKLKHERAEKEKALMKDKDDVTAQLAVEEWYNTEILKAARTRDEALKHVSENKLSDLIDEGDFVKVQEFFQSVEAMQKQWADGNKELAQAYADVWQEAHKSVGAEFADFSRNVYSTMTDTFREFLRGTKSAMDAVHDFGNLVLDTIAQIVAKRAASTLVDSLFTSFSFGGLGQWAGATGGEIGRYATGGAIAGGYISGAGTGTSDSIVAYLESTGQFIRLSDGEFVMTAEATRKNRPMLEAMNAGAYSGGGYISAPSVRTGYGGGSYVSHQSQPSGGVVVNITNNTDSKITAKESGFDVNTQRYILDIVVDGAQRNVGGFGSNMKALMR